MILRPRATDDLSVCLDKANQHFFSLSMTNTNFQSEFLKLFENLHLTLPPQIQAFW